MPTQWNRHPAAITTSASRSLRAKSATTLGVTPRRNSSRARRKAMFSTIWMCTQLWSLIPKPRVGALTRTPASASRTGIGSGTLATGGLQQHTLPQAPLADLKRGTELLRGGLQDQQTRRQQPHPLELERESPRDRRRALAGQQPQRPGERLGIQQRAGQAPQRRSAAPHRDRLARMRDLERVDRAGDHPPSPRQLLARGRIGAKTAVREIPGADPERR